MKIAIAGTGYVGLSNAVILAQHHEVWALDLLPEKVELINSRRSPIEDVELEEYLATKPLNLTATLDQDGQLLDFEKTFNDLGVLDKISPAAISTIKSLYGGKFNVLPYQYNIEGFWYNKQIFADNALDRVTATVD